MIHASQSIALPILSWCDLAMRRIAILLIAAVVLTGCEKAPEHEPLTWLALGDSYSAGIGTGGDLNPPCFRSEHAWAPVAYRLVGESMELGGIDFLACTGALVRSSGVDGNIGGNNVDTQLAQVPEGVRYDVISFSFGGNDWGFVEILRDCSVLGELLPNIECMGRLEIARREMPDVTNSVVVLIERLIKDYLTNDGTIIVVGYPFIFEEPFVWKYVLCSGMPAGTPLELRIDLAAAMDAFQLALSSIPEAVFVDLTTEESATGDQRLRESPVGLTFNNHNLCSANGPVWVNSIVTVLANSTLGNPLRQDVPLFELMGVFHPSADGHQAIAYEVQRVVLSRLASEPLGRDGAILAVQNQWARMLAADAVRVPSEVEEDGLPDPSRIEPFVATDEAQQQPVASIGSITFLPGTTPSAVSSLYDENYGPPDEDSVPFLVCLRLMSSGNGFGVLPIQADRESIIARLPPVEQVIFGFQRDGRDWKIVSAGVIVDGTYTHSFGSEALLCPTQT